MWKKYVRASKATNDNTQYGTFALHTG